MWMKLFDMVKVWMKLFDKCDFVNSNNKLPRPVRVYKTSGTLFLTILCKSCTSAGVWVGVLLTKQRQNLLPSGQNCRWRKRGERKQGNSIGRWENRDNKQRDWARSLQQSRSQVYPNLTLWKLLSSTFMWYCFFLQGGSNLWVSGWNPSVWPFKWKLLSSSFMW